MRLATTGSETTAAQGCLLTFQPFCIGISPLVLRGRVGWGTHPALSPARSPAGTQEELCCGHPHTKLCWSKISTCKHKPVHSRAPGVSRPSGTPQGMLKSCNVSAFTLPRTKLLLDQPSLNTPCLAIAIQEQRNQRPPTCPVAMAPDF